MLAFANVVHFFADEFSRLGRWGFAFAGIPLRALHRLSLRHKSILQVSHVLHRKMHCSLEKM